MGTTLSLALVDGGDGSGNPAAGLSDVERRALEIRHDAAMLVLRHDRANPRPMTREQRYDLLSEVVFPSPHCRRRTEEEAARLLREGAWPHAA